MRCLKGGGSRIHISPKHVQRNSSKENSKKLSNYTLWGNRNSKRWYLIGACFSNTHYRYAKTCWGVGIFLKPSSPGATFSSCNFKSLILNPVKKTCPGSQLNSDTSAIFPESSHSSVCRLLLIFLFHCQSDYLTADMLNKPSCVFPLRLPSRSLLSWVCPGRRCSQ